MTASPESSRRRAERVRKALALRDAGASREEIARRVGVSRHTIGAYMRDPDGSKGKRWRENHVGACRHCGAETSNPKIDCCAKCAPNEGPPWLWTREAIVEAIRAWVLTYGKPPSSRDWAAGSIEGERRARYRRLNTSRVQNSRRGLVPAATTVYGHFGSWTAAIEAAGFTPLKPGGQKARRGSERRECSKGHRLDEENTFLDYKGVRRCRVCQREHQRNSKIRKRARERGLIIGEPEIERKEDDGTPARRRAKSSL